MACKIVFVVENIAQESFKVPRRVVVVEGIGMLECRYSMSCRVWLITIPIRPRPPPCSHHLACAASPVAALEGPRPASKAVCQD